MKILLWVVLSVSLCQAFIVNTRIQRTPSCLQLSYDLLEEPEGGEELTPMVSMPGCRVKKMEELKNVKCDFGTPYEFWMTAEVDGALIKEVRTQILKDASKKANFPGFRKVRDRTDDLASMLVFAARKVSLTHHKNRVKFLLMPSPKLLSFLSKSQSSKRLRRLWTAMV